MNFKKEIKHNKMKNAKSESFLPDIHAMDCVSAGWIVKMKDRMKLIALDTPRFNSITKRSTQEPVWRRTLMRKCPHSSVPLICVPRMNETFNIGR